MALNNTKIIITVINKKSLKKYIDIYFYLPNKYYNLQDVRTDKES